MGSPKEIVSGFLFARLLESKDECPLRIHSTKNMANNAVLTGGVECLQNHEEGLAPVRVEQVLQLVHACGVSLRLGQSLLMAFVIACVRGRFSIDGLWYKARL